MEQTLFAFFSQAPFLVSVLAGILTFLSPCVLPLIPAYLSYVSGISLSELRDSDKLSLQQRLLVLRNALFFVLGFAVIFLVIGASMAKLLGGGFLLHPFVGYFAGGVLIIFGLHVAKVINLPFLNYQKNFQIETSNKFAFLKDFFAPFLLGVSFALGWTPCVGPIFAGIISLASLDEERGIFLMLFYTLGLGFSFLLTAFLMGYAFNFLNKLKAHFRLIEWISGGLLVLIGILVATGGLVWLSNAILMLTL